MSGGATLNFARPLGFDSGRRSQVDRGGGGGGERRGTTRTLLPKPAPRARTPRPSRACSADRRAKFLTTEPRPRSCGEPEESSPSRRVITDFQPFVANCFDIPLCFCYPIGPPTRPPTCPPTDPPRAGPPTCPPAHPPAHLAARPSARPPARPTVSPADRPPDRPPAGRPPDRPPDRQLNRPLVRLGQLWRPAAPIPGHVWKNFGATSASFGEDAGGPETPKIAFLTEIRAPMFVQIRAPGANF